MLYGSSGTLDGITALISRFYGGSQIRLERGEKEWTIHNSRGQIDGVRVVLRKLRYRFEKVA